MNSQGTRAVRSAGVPWYFAVLLIVANLAIYGQTLGFDFVSFDDYTLVVKNPMVQKGLAWDSLTWAFSNTEGSYWRPVTWVSHLLTVSAFGMNPARHHAVNVFLHLANALLLFHFLRRATGSEVRSGLAALLYSLHPLRVEAVAWVIGRPELLGAFFFLVTLIAYVRYVRRPGGRRYLMVLLPYCVGLMAKPTLVTLPGVFLLLDYWPLGRISSAAPEIGIFWKGNARPGLQSLLIEKIPFFALSLAASAVTLFSAGGGRHLIPIWYYPVSVRIGNALTSYVLYVWNTVWPSRLAFFYPHPGDSLPAWQPAAAAILLLSATAWAISQRKRHPFLVTGWAWFCITLLPVIGLFQVGDQARADRFTYLPAIGLSIFLVWGAGEYFGWDRRGSGGRSAQAAAIAAMVLLVPASYVQAGYWRNSKALYERALSVTERNWIAHHNLGIVLMKEGRIEEAKPHLLEAIRLKPDQPGPYATMAVLLEKEGNVEAALGYAKSASLLHPTSAKLRMEHAWLLDRSGNLPEAVLELREATRLAPLDPSAWFALGMCVGRMGKFDESVESLREAARLKPDDPEIRRSLEAATRPGRR